MSEDTWATTRTTEVPRPKASIQWKGTDVCLDFRCPCGFQGHFDGEFAYALTCTGCGRTWTMPTTVGLIADGDPDGALVPVDHFAHGDPSSVDGP